MVLALVATLGTWAAAPAPEAEAADMTQFDPGNIISDEVFYDRWAMSQDQVRSFLITRLGSCAAGATCLLNYRESTWTRASDSYCAGYQGAPNETPEAVIVKVAQSCGINPRVLLVTLQKEQSLLTTRSLRPRQLEIAMGYGCPDSAPCDAQYYGFYNQVYMAARQFTRYKSLPASYRYRAGQNNTIQYSTNPACGSSVVYIHNVATASLYNYTPYQPNASALTSSYAAGDACSQTGNRNFYSFFSDWFGMTTYDVPGAIGVYWRSIGASQSEVGSPVGRAVTYSANGGGHAQEFTSGYIYSSGAGTFHVRKNSAIFARYAALNSQYGALSWPAGNETCTSSTCQTRFHLGTITWSASTGAIEVTGAFEAAYAAAGRYTGPLGVAASAPVSFNVNGGGSAQSFAGGHIYSSQAGTFALRKSSGIFAAYAAQNSQYGPLGWPASDETCTANGCQVIFTGGTITWSAATGVFAVTGNFNTVYAALGRSTGVLGAAASSPTSFTANGGGSAQSFAGGYIYSSPAGTFHQRKNSAIFAAYAAQGSQYGALGWPSSEETCTATTCQTTFTGGTITWSAEAGVRVVSGPIEVAYAAAGRYTGILGVATSGPGNFTTNGGGQAQSFVGGHIYSSPAGTYHLRKNSAIFASYAAQNSQYGALGWPASNETCGATGCQVIFTGGTVTWSPATGVQTVTGAINGSYATHGRIDGALGAAAGKALIYSVNGGGSAQDFVGGYVYSSASGAFALRKNSLIFNKYSEQGSQYGSWGWPTSNEECHDLTCEARFTGGSIVWHQRWGLATVPGVYDAVWTANGRLSGELKNPVGQPVYYSPNGGGSALNFTGGYIYSSPAGTFALATSSPVYQQYAAQGSQNGALGWPTSSVTCGNGTCQATFQGGSIQVPVG